MPEEFLFPHDFYLVFWRRDKVDKRAIEFNFDRSSRDAVHWTHHRVMCDRSKGVDAMQSSFAHEFSIRSDATAKATAAAERTVRLNLLIRFS